MNKAITALKARGWRDSVRIRGAHFMKFGDYQIGVVQTGIIGWHKFDVFCAREDLEKFGIHTAMDETGLEAAFIA